MSLLRSILIALAIAVSASPAAQAKLDAGPPVAVQTQDLRSPDTRDVATARTAPATTGDGGGIDGTTWALIAFAILACGVIVVSAARSRRIRVPA